MDTGPSNPVAKVLHSAITRLTEAESGFCTILYQTVRQDSSPNLCVPPAVTLRKNERFNAKCTKRIGQGSRRQRQEGILKPYEKPVGDKTGSAAAAAASRGAARPPACRSVTTRSPLAGRPDAESALPLQAGPPPSPSAPHSRTVL